MTELRVELHGRHVGDLVGEGSTFDFVAAPDAVERHGVGSVVLSLAVPLTTRSPARRVATRRAYFAGLLPEGDGAKVLATTAGVRVSDTMGMLRAYGRDIAGAVQIWDPADPEEPRTPRYEPVDDADISAMLRDVTAQPLGNKPRRGKTSLAGVQPKVTLARVDGAWMRAVEGAPTTHIVKPKVPVYPGMIFDEEYGSRFARALDLASFDTRLESFDGEPGLVIERYDRVELSRVHQEDFSQVLGLIGDAKYEKFDGRPLRDVAKLLQPRDRVRLFRQLALSVALGNLDFHAKNISLLHDESGGFRLAPMYDVVPQTFHDNDGEMAFAVDGVFEHRLISLDNLLAEGKRLGLSQKAAKEGVDTVLGAVLQLAQTEVPHPAAQPDLAHIIGRIARNLVEGRAAGDDGAGLTTASGSAPSGAWENPARIARR